MATLRDRLRGLFSDKEFDADVRGTYFTLRLWLAAIGIFLPIILVGWGLTHGIASSAMTSISAFHWLPCTTDCNCNAPLRDVLCGSQCTIGICLIIYRGYGRLENWLLKLAGVAVTVVALDPIACPLNEEAALSAHTIATKVFFLLMALTIWLCAGNTLHRDLPHTVRSCWRRIYDGFAIAMALAPFLPHIFARASQRTIWIEAISGWVFSLYWLVKTIELSRVSKVEPRGEPPPKLEWDNGELKIVSS